MLVPADPMGMTVTNFLGIGLADGFNINGKIQIHAGKWMIEVQIDIEPAHLDDPSIDGTIGGIDLHRHTRL